MSKDKVVLFSPQIETFVPFANNVDPSRLQMASKQLTQVVVSKHTETPIVIDKYYSSLSEISSPYSEIAEDDGVVLFSKKEILILYYTNEKRMIFKQVPKFKKLINNSLSLKYNVADHKKSFKKGDLLFDYTNMIPDSNVPKIGYRANILFSSFFGYAADDAVVISEGFSNRTQVEYSEKIFIPVTKQMRFLKNGLDYLPKIGDTIKSENILSYYMIDASEFFLTEVINLDEHTESKYYTKGFKGIQGGTIENIKIHIKTKKTFEESRNSYLYTKELIDELEYYDNIQKVTKVDLENCFNSLKLPEDKVSELRDTLYSQYVSMDNIPKAVLNDMRDNYNLDPDDIDYIIEVDTSYTDNTSRGDKFTNLYAGKGVVGLVLPDSLMPKDPLTGKAFDMVFNPLGIFGRNNWGSIFELSIGKILRDIESTQDLDLFKRKLEFINNTLIKWTDEEYFQKVQYNLENNLQELRDDVTKNNLYLYFSNFNNITYHKFFDEFIKPYETAFDYSLNNKSPILFEKKLITYLRSYLGFESTIFKKGEVESYYDQTVECYYGENYLSKLYHTSNSKYNAIAFTNSYSKTTGQPTRGRKKQGGQHISWQTTAALLSHKSKNSILKELFTFKSDSMEDKESFLMKIIKDGEYVMKDRYESNTKKTINNALKMIGMEFLNEDEILIDETEA